MLKPGMSRRVEVSTRSPYVPLHCSERTSSEEKVQQRRMRALLEMVPTTRICDPDVRSFVNSCVIVSLAGVDIYLS